MQLLPDGKVRIQNTQTGETRDIDPIELPKYNPGLVAEYQTLKSQVTKPVTPTQPAAPTADPEQAVKKSLMEKIGGGAINIAKNLAQPFVQTGKTIAGAGYEGVRAAKSAMGDKNAYVNQETGEVVQNPFISEQELAGARDITDPEGILRKQLAGSAGVASWAVPFGKGSNVITKAALPGAAAGTLQGLSDPNATAEEVAGSAVVGAVLPSIVYGAGKVKGALSKGGEKLEQTGKEITRSVRQTRLKPEVGGAQKEQLIDETLDALGFKGSPQQQYKMLQPSMNKLETDIRSTLKGSEIVFKPKQVQDEIISTLDDQGFLIGANNKSKATQALKDVMHDVVNKTKSKELTSTELFNVKQKLNKIGQRIQDKMDRGIAVKPEEEVLVAARDALDDVIAKYHPDVKGMTLAQSRLFDSARSLSGARSNPPTLRLGSTSVPAKLTTGVTQLAGEATQKAGRGAQAISNMLPDITGNAPLVGAARVPSVMEGLDQNTNYPEGGVDNQTTNKKTDNQLNTQGDHTSIIPSTLNPYGATPEIIYREYQNALNAGDKKTAAQLRTMYEDEVEYQKSSVTKPTKYSEGDKKFLLAENEAQKALDTLSKGNVKTGKVANVGSKFSEFFGTQDPKTTAFKSQLATARTAARNALLGANMSDAELESYLDAIFDYSNEPAIIKTKLETFVNSMKDYKNKVAGQSDLLPDITGGIQ